MHVHEGWGGGAWWDETPCPSRRAPGRETTVSVATSGVGTNMRDPRVRMSHSRPPCQTGGSILQSDFQDSSRPCHAVLMNPQC